MGNYHCIPEGCGRVVYQQYVSDYVKLFYQNHGTWIFRGEGITVNSEQVVKEGQNPFCCANVYDVEIRYRTKRTFSDGRVDERWETYKNSSFLGDLDTSFGSGGFVVDNDTYRSPAINSIFFRSTPCDKTTGAYRNYETTGVFYYEVTSDINIIKWDFKYTHNNCQYDCRTTVKGINEDGEPFEWQKDHYQCPEITRGCRLSDEIKQVDIKKIPYLERIEVVPYAYSSYRLSGVPAPIVQIDDIPPECLNIYNNAFYVLIPPDNALEHSETVPFESFVKQICSSAGCPPPEYQVICDCECESCPDGTCPVECGDHICCIDTTTGKAIKEISINQYCGEEI